jgi:hypothetical protein
MSPEYIRASSRRPQKLGNWEKPPNYVKCLFFAAELHRIAQIDSWSDLRHSNFDVSGHLHAGQEANEINSDEFIGRTVGPVNCTGFDFP